VQSTIKPNWEWCFHNAPDFLAAPPQVKTYEPDYRAGEKLRFRIKLNPTVKTRNYKNDDQTLDNSNKPSKRLAGFITIVQGLIIVFVVSGLGQ